MLDDDSKAKLEIKSIRFHKNFAIIKFKEISNINDLIEFKGQRIFISKNAALENLEEDEFLIKDLIGCEVSNSMNEIMQILYNLKSKHECKSSKNKQTEAIK